MHERDAYHPLFFCYKGFCIFETSFRFYFLSDNKIIFRIYFVYRSLTCNFASVYYKKV